MPKIRLALEPGLDIKNVAIATNLHFKQEGSYSDRDGISTPVYVSGSVNIITAKAIKAALATTKRVRWVEIV